MVDRVRAHLTDDLRKAKYQGDPNPMKGHCYVASEALFFMLGGRDAGWKAMHIHLEGDTHWFLRHEDGTILDPTSDQFKTKVPYEKATGCGFLTKGPDARTRTLYERMGVDLP
jgi:hypothetical protein